MTYLIKFLSVPSLFRVKIKDLLSVPQQDRSLPYLQCLLKDPDPDHSSLVNLSFLFNNNCQHLTHCTTYLY